MRQVLLAQCFGIFCACAALADLPKLTNTTPEAVAAHARDRATHQESAALSAELAKALGALAREGDAKNLEQRVQLPAISLAAAQLGFLRSVPAATLTQISKAQRGDEFLSWILGDQSSLDDFLYAGAPPHDAGAALTVLHRIWLSDDAAQSGVSRRIAIATALEHATPVLPWSEWDDRSAPTIDPVARYAFYRDSWKAKTLFPSFDELPTWEMRRVVDLPLYDEDVKWIQDHLPNLPPVDGKSQGKNLRTQQEIGNAMWLIAYRDINPSNGHSVQLGKPFYDGKRLTPQIMLEYGGVCGAVSKFGSFAARAFGVPAQPLGQEGHCASCWKAEPDRWITGNCGGPDDWAVSNLHGLWSPWTARGVAIPLQSELQRTPEYLRSLHAFEMLRAADLAESKRLVRSIEVAELCPRNLILWRAIVDEIVHRENAKPEELRRLAKAIITGLASTPQLAIDALTPIESSKSFAAFSAKERERWCTTNVESLLAAVADENGARKVKGSLVPAWREFLGRQVWLLSGKTAGFGDWPYLANIGVLAGTHGGWKEWWKAAERADRERVTDFLARAVSASLRRPNLAEIPLHRLIELAESDESLRATAAKAADTVAEAYSKAREPEKALAIYRAMILSGERIGHRSWIKGYSEKAIKARSTR